MIRFGTKQFLGWTLAVIVSSVASAADPLPDRRAVRPGVPAVPPIPTTARPGTPPATPAPNAPVAANQGLVELLGEIETLQTQLREMRNQLDVQGHELQQMKNRLQQSQIDVDRRLRELERRGGGPASDAGASSPTAATTPSAGGGTVPPVATAPAARANPSASEQQQYDAAFALMKQGLYEQAAKNFREFLVRHPKGVLVDNAQYWIGEAAYVTRDFRGALEEFGKVVNDYPQSPKVPDALLKIGYTHYELAAYAKARETLTQVAARYPNTTVGRAAQARLEKMGKEAR